MVIGEGKADPSYVTLMNLFHFSQKAILNVCKLPKCCAIPNCKKAMQR